MEQDRILTPGKSPTVRMQSKAQYDTVTNLCGDHARSRLTTAFESKYPSRVPLISQFIQFTTWTR